MISTSTFNVLEMTAKIPAIPPLKNKDRLKVNTPSLAPSPAGKKNAVKPTNQAMENEPINKVNEACSPRPHRIN